jgi:flavin-dependent thymidylate synthase
MFPAVPIDPEAVGTPKVHLVWMTPDPLGAIASAAQMYEGTPYKSLDDISDDDRMRLWEDVQHTHLTAPLEFVKLHFFFEGVNRAFTHQLVRQRTAVYAQESMRFAVKENLKDEVPYPPSLRDPAKSPSWRNDAQDSWDRAVEAVDREYKFLIAHGVPAEDARGLIPTDILTRVNYCTDLRNLADHAGNRLCTQAQFHWRQVFLGIRDAIRGYQHNRLVTWDKAWQFDYIADSMLFSPVCYKLNRCPFKADFDRGCTIRPRVDAFEKNGIPSSKWYPQIDPVEWLEDPKAGWVK